MWYEQLHIRVIPDKIDAWFKETNPNIHPGVVFRESKFQ